MKVFLTHSPPNLSVNKEHGCNLSEKKKTSLYAYTHKASVIQASESPDYIEEDASE